jgi:hypothetical protein
MATNYWFKFRNCVQTECIFVKIKARIALSPLTCPCLEVASIYTFTSMETPFILMKGRKSVLHVVAFF